MNKGNLSLVAGLVIYPYFVEAQNNLLKPDKPNVLFIAVDDLRPELGCYGQTHIKSPNIDRLARSGIVFENAYANYPVCGPSRASLMSGIYPSTNRFGWVQDQDLPGVVSLPMHFRNNNYKTIALGKIYHNRLDGKGSWHKNWNPPFITDHRDYHSEENIQILEKINKEPYINTRIGDGPVRPPNALPFEKADVPDNTYFDGRIANRAIEELWHLQNSSEPFFLAVGFNKPHLPFNAPAKYWELYDEKDIKLPSNYYFPKDAPDASRFEWHELRNYHGIPKKGPVPDTAALRLIHGYYACVSYVDAQIGLVINALEYLGLADNTIIVLWGDHGFFLGEHGFWCKQINFKRAAHSPLIVSVPWKNSGLRTGALVEFVDIYPTLCELAGLSLPFHLQGRSLAPLIDDPAQPWKEAVFYRIGNGETIITETHSYTEWIARQTYARMLFDLQKDPDENINISEHSESKNIIEDLQKRLYNHIEGRDILNLLQDVQ